MVLDFHLVVHDLVPARALLVHRIGASVETRHKVEVRRDLDTVPPRPINRDADDDHREYDTDTRGDLCASSVRESWRGNSSRLTRSSIASVTGVPTTLVMISITRRAEYIAAIRRVSDVAVTLLVNSRLTGLYYS